MRLLAAASVALVVGFAGTRLTLALASGLAAPVRAALPEPDIQPVGIVTPERVYGGQAFGQHLGGKAGGIEERPRLDVACERQGFVQQRVARDAIKIGVEIRALPRGHGAGAGHVAEGDMQHLMRGGADLVIER